MLDDIELTALQRYHQDPPSEVEVEDNDTYAEGGNQIPGAVAQQMVMRPIPQEEGFFESLCSCFSSSNAER